MISVTTDLQPEKIFTPRRRRALLSFRRRGDLLWFAVSVGMFVAGSTAVAYTALQARRPFIVERPIAPPPAPVRPQPPPVEIISNPAPAPAAVTPPPTPAPTITPPPAAVIAPSPVAKEKPKPPEPAGLALLENEPDFRADVYKEARLQVIPAEVSGEPVLRMEFQVGPREWAQASMDVDRDLAKYKRVQFSFTMEGKINSIDFSATDADGTTVGVTRAPLAGGGLWSSVDLPLTDLGYLFGGNKAMDWKNAARISFGVSVKAEESGGAGRVVIRGLRFY